MNARTVFAMLVAIGLSGSVFAEGETSESTDAETVTETSQSESVLSVASSAGNELDIRALVPAPDFRRVQIGDGRFDEPSSTAFKVFGAGMFVAAGADLLSTEYGLTRPGIYETNPIQGNRSVRILTHAATPALMYYVTEKLRDSGKPKLALLARIGFSVGYSYVVMHNLRTAATAP